MWEVKPCVKYMSSTTHGFRVQRAVRVNDVRYSGIEMAFAHDSKELCNRIAQTLNQWEEDNESGNESSL